MSWEDFEWLGWPGMRGDKPSDAWATRLGALRAENRMSPGGPWARTADLMATVVSEVRRMAPRHLFVPAHADAFDIRVPEAASGSLSLALSDPVMRAVKDVNAVFTDRFARRPFLVELLAPLFTVLRVRPELYLVDPTVLMDAAVVLPPPSGEDLAVYDASFYEAGVGDGMRGDRGVVTYPLTIEDHRDGSVAISGQCSQDGDVLQVWCQARRADLTVAHAAELIRRAFLDAYGGLDEGVRRLQVDDVSTGDTVQVHCETQA